MKEGIFIEPDDVPTIAFIDSLFFNGTNIRRKQNYVSTKGVDFFKKTILDGERPFVLVDTFNGLNFIVDGHHRMTAYRSLGIKEIPVIDRKSKLTRYYVQ